MLSILEVQEFANSINKVIYCTKIIKLSLFLTDNSSSKIEKCLYNFAVMTNKIIFIYLFIYLAHHKGLIPNQLYVSHFWRVCLLLFIAWKTY